MFDGPFADTELLRYQEQFTQSREVPGVGIVYIIPDRSRDRSGEAGPVASAWRVERLQHEGAPAWAREYFGTLEGAEAPTDERIQEQWAWYLAHCE